MFYILFNPILWALILVVSIFVFFFFITYKRLREIKDTPTTDIRDLEEGRVEIKATISSESERIISPLSQTECVWFSFVIKEQVRSGKNTRWEIIYNAKKYKKCILDDGTGTCEIRPFHVDFELSTCNHGESGRFDNPTERELRVLQELGLETENFLGFNKTYSYEEHVLLKGEELYILGNCVQQQDDTNSMVIEGTPENPIILSNKSENELITIYEGRIWGGVGCLIVFVLGLIPFVFSVG